MTRGSSTTTLAEWRDWYLDLIASLPAMTADDIVIAWLARTRPNVWRLAWDPYPAERAAWSGLYVGPAADEWWGPEGLALSQVQACREHHIWRPIPPGEPGYYLRPPIGQVASLSAVALLKEHGWDVRSRLRVPVAPSEGPDQEFAFRNVLGLMRHSLAHVALRKASADRTPPPDWDGDPALWTGRRRRSGVQRASLARALLIRGLVADGVRHRTAIRVWLDWEIELAGPWSRRRSTRSAWKLLRAGDDASLYALRDFEESRAGADRQLWQALGIDPESSGSA